VGFEPTNNGFANRFTADVTDSENSTCGTQEKNLAHFLALLTAKYPELGAIIEAWPNLPEYIKQSIKALVETHKEKG